MGILGPATSEDDLVLSWELPNSGTLGFGALYFLKLTVIENESSSSDNDNNNDLPSSVLIVEMFEILILSLLSSSSYWFSMNL